MARDYYDWRGIAMLTQQLGQLFEPSKARLMSEQQQHEMNMLMAKKSWDVESKQLEKLKVEYDGVLSALETQKSAVQILGGEELVAAGMRDGANPEQSAEMYEKLDVKMLSDLQKLSLEYSEMIRNTRKNLDNMTGYNETAKIGEKFGTDYKGEKGARNYLELYDVEPETPGFLSPEERENVKHAALTDMFIVEDIENKVEGRDYMTYTAAGKPINIRPEGIAFVAGFDSAKASPAEARREKAVKARAVYAKPQHTLDEWLNIDSAWMDLTAADQTTIGTALKNPDIAKNLSPALKDTYLAMKKRDELSVKLMGSDLNDRIQPLSDVDFQPEDAPYWGTGDIQKPWVTLGLDKEMYSSLRRLGSKGGNTRGAFEHLIRNWEDIDDNLRVAYVNQIKLEHSQLVGI